MGLALQDCSQRRSLRRSLRQRRFLHFLKLFHRQPKPVTILDVGGTPEFWRTMGFDAQDESTITLLNLDPTAVTGGPFRTMVGDARDLSPFEDGEFTIVFSNSVIEHVGTFDDQRRMAEEIRRVGRCHYVQTPNRYFPVEPHVQFPLFQFLPASTRAFMHQKMSLASYPKARSAAEAREWADEIRLLTRREFQQLFPDSRIVSEKFFGLTKSFMAIHYDEG